MIANLNTNIKLKGTTQELIQMIKVIKDNKYLNSQTINKKYIDMMSDNELEILIKDNNNEISINADGPYGQYRTLSDTKIFESITDVAPNAYFYGTMSGFQGSGDVELTGELKDKKLYLTYLDNNSNKGGYDSYMKYLNKTFPKKKFCKLFQIDEDDLDEDDYEDFFTSEYLDMINIDDFKDYFNYSEIEEDEFVEAQEKYEKLNIYDYYTFENIKAEESARTWTYDPFNPPPKKMTNAEFFAREISDNVDKIEFEGKIFVHTYCNDGLDSYITNRGGIVKSSVVLNTDYIIIGDYISDKTVKIERAIELNKNKGKNIKALTLSQFEEVIKNNK